MLPLLVLCLAAATTSLPSPNEGITVFHLSREDYIFINNLPRGRVGQDIPGFSYIFVDTNGQSSYTRGAVGTQIEIAGSPLTSQDALIVAASVVAKMTQYMPENIFQQLATHSSVGIFTAAEKLIVFPEYAYLANGNCGSSCTGTCSHTCTFDGRKYEDIAGVGGRRGVVLDDNVLCTPQDPYRRSLNILSHEFTHTIHINSLSSSVKQQILSAYGTAKASGTWVLSSYAMADEYEYFAVGASVYFFVYNDNNHSGGMSSCGGSQYCTSEWQAREYLRVKDPGLYNVLTYVFTDNRPTLLSGLTICPSGTIVG